MSTISFLHLNEKTGKLFQVSYWGQICIYATRPSIAVQRKRQMKREKRIDNTPYTKLIIKVPLNV